MHKQELIHDVAKESGHSQAVVREVLAATNSVVRGALKRGKEVFLLGLGILRPSKRPPRVARNIHTGARVSVPERMGLHFRPSAGLRDAVKGGPKS